MKDRSVPQSNSSNLGSSSFSKTWHVRRKLKSCGIRSDIIVQYRFSGLRLASRCWVCRKENRFHILSLSPRPMNSHVIAFYDLQGSFYRRKHHSSSCYFSVQRRTIIQIMTLSMLALKHQKEEFTSPDKLSTSTWQVLRLCSPHKNKLNSFGSFFCYVFLLLIQLQ